MCKLSENQLKQLKTKLQYPPEAENYSIVPNNCLYIQMSDKMLEKKQYWLKFITLGSVRGIEFDKNLHWYECLKTMKTTFKIDRYQRFLERLFRFKVGENQHFYVWNDKNQRFLHLKTTRVDASYVYNRQNQTFLGLKTTETNTENHGNQHGKRQKTTLRQKPTFSTFENNETQLVFEINKEQSFSGLKPKTTHSSMHEYGNYWPFSRSKLTEINASYVRKWSKPTLCTFQNRQKPMLLTSKIVRKQGFKTK